VKKTKMSKFILGIFKSPWAVNWLYLAPGIAAGYYGARFLWNGGEPDWLRGTPLHLLSAFLIWKAFADRPPLAEKTESLKVRKTGGPQPEISTGLFFVFLILAAAGQYLFALDRPFWGLVPWAFAFAAFWKVMDSVRGEGSPKIFPAEYAWLGGVLLIAALMRFPFAAQHVTGLQIDEANTILYASKVLSGELKSPFCTVGMLEHTFHHFLLAGAFRLFGETCAVARAFSAAVSIAALYFFYLLCRFFFGPWASLLATFLMSIGWWFLFCSLSPFQNITVCFFVILVFYFMEKGMRSGRKADFCLAGIISGFCCMEYLSGRLVPLIVGISVLIILAARGRAFIKAYWPLILLMFLAFWWAVMPFVFFGMEYPSQIFERTKELNLFSEIKRTGHYWLLPQKIGWTILSLVWPNFDTDRRFCPLGRSEMDPFSGALMLLGLLLALSGLRKRVNAYIFAGFAFGIMTNAFAIQGADPNPRFMNCERSFIIVPFLFLMVARFADWLFAYSRLFKPPLRIAGKVLLVLALAFTVVWNVRAYYFGFKNPLQWCPVGYQHIQVAEYLKAVHESVHLVMVDWRAYTSVERVLTRDRVKVTEIKAEGSLSLPIENKVEKDVLLVINMPDFNEKHLKEVYPGAVWDEIKDPMGYSTVRTVKISKSDIEASQKGMKLKEKLP
jgi:hypothetical protein